jgi:hypothetical protein
MIKLTSLKHDNETEAPVYYCVRHNKIITIKRGYKNGK